MLSVTSLKTVQVFYLSVHHTEAITATNGLGDN